MYERDDGIKETKGIPGAEITPSATLSPLHYDPRIPTCLRRFLCEGSYRSTSKLLSNNDTSIDKQPHIPNRWISKYSSSQFIIYLKKKEAFRHYSRINARSLYGCTSTRWRQFWFTSEQSAGRHSSPAETYFHQSQPKRKGEQLHTFQKSQQRHPSIKLDPQQKTQQRQ